MKSKGVASSGISQSAYSLLQSNLLSYLFRSLKLLSLTPTRQTARNHPICPRVQETLNSHIWSSTLVAYSQCLHLSISLVNFSSRSIARQKEKCAIQSTEFLFLRKLQTLRKNSNKEKTFPSSEKKVSGQIRTRQGEPYFRVRSRKDSKSTPFLKALNLPVSSICERTTCGKIRVPNALNL